MRKKERSRSLFFFIVLFLGMMQFCAVFVMAKTLSGYEEITSKFDPEYQLKELLGIEPEEIKDDTVAPNYEIFDDASSPETPPINTDDSSQADDTPSDSKSGTPEDSSQYSDDSYSDYSETPSISSERYTNAIPLLEQKELPPPAITAAASVDTLSLTINSDTDATARVSVLGQTYSLNAHEIKVQLPPSKLALTYVLVVVSQNGVSCAQYIPIDN
ncbi:MAG: hypothetical protein V1726_08770 [Methanobacteriota archaeon]